MNLPFGDGTRHQIFPELYHANYTSISEGEGLKIKKRKKATMITLYMPPQQV